MFRIRFCALLILAVLLPIPAAAQTTTATLDFGYTVELPDGWTIADPALTTRSNATVLTNGSASILLLTPPQVTGLYPEADRANLWGALTELHLRLYDGIMGPGVDNVWQARYEDSPALMYSYGYEIDGQSISGQSIILDWPPAGGLVFLDLTVPADGFLDAAEDMPNFILTLRAAPATTVDLGDGYVADLPHGWQLVDPSDNPRPDGTMLTAGDVRMVLLTRPQLSALYPDVFTPDIWDAFVGLHLLLHDGLVGDGAAAEIGDSGRMVIRYPYQYVGANEQPIHGLSLFYPQWGADDVVFVDADGPPYQFDARRAQIEAIVLSVRPDGE